MRQPPERPENSEGDAHQQATEIVSQATEEILRKVYARDLSPERGLNQLGQLLNFLLTGDLPAGSPQADVTYKQVPPEARKHEQEMERLREENRQKQEEHKQRQEEYRQKHETMVTWMVTCITVFSMVIGTLLFFCAPNPDLKKLALGLIPAGLTGGLGFIAGQRQTK